MFDASLIPLTISNHRLARTASGLSDRGMRMNWLLGGVVSLSLVDLVLTLQQMCTVGMFEGNPLVHQVVELCGSPLAIVGFKALTVAVAVGLLHRTRLHVESELSAWIALSILAVLTMRWVAYLSFMMSLDPAILNEFRKMDGWIVL